MKRLISIICSIALLMGGIYSGTLVVAAATTFADEMDDSSKISSKIGAWDFFASHPEIGLSVAGRTTTGSENSLTYSFTGQAVTSLAVKMVEYHGFFSAADYAAEVKTKGSSSWTVLSMIASPESNIPGKESLGFKLVTLTAESLPANVTQVKITLKNAVNWTLFIDCVTMDLGELQSGGGEDTLSFTDSLGSLEGTSRSEGNWTAYSQHPEFGQSVVGRANTEQENYIYYSFADGEIASVNVGVVAHADFFVPEDCELAVRAVDTDSWSAVPIVSSAKSNIPGYESLKFKLAKLTADDIPKNMRQLRIRLKNPVAWTLFLDSVTVNGCSQMVKNEVYNEQLLSFTGGNGTKLNYYLVTPEDYDPKSKYPVVFFMHGVGGETDLSGYIHLRDRLFKNDYKCIMIAPLADRSIGQWWVDYDKVLRDNDQDATYKVDDVAATPSLLAARDLLGTIEHTYPVDTERVYMIGVSMGGYATWDIMSRFPDLISAAVPICGGTDPSKAEKIKDIPTWTFHGDMDAAVNINGTRAMVEALKAAGSKGIKYTEYAGLDHGIWFKVFDEPEMLPWLFEQRRAVVIPATEKEEFFIDPMENLEAATSYTAGWDVFNPHPETGLSVIGRKSPQTPSSIFYTFTDKTIKKASFNLQVAEASIALEQDFVVEVRASNAEEWKKVSVTKGETLAIPGASSTVFKTMTVTTPELPESTSQIKITLNNETLWALFIDEVKLSMKTAYVSAAPKSWNFTDDMTSYKQMASHSDNLQFFSPHPETNLNVLAKKNAKRGYVSYCFEGRTISDLEIVLQIAPEYFLQSRDLLVQYRLEGSDTFKELTVMCSKATPINQTFSTMSVVPDAALSDRVAEVKIMMYNDVAWTLMLDEIKLELTGKGIPATGESISKTFLFNIMIAAAFVMLNTGAYLFKRQKT